MVIAQSPMGEYDRRVVLLTLEKGKISAFARGARKPNSHLVGASQPMCFGTFSLYPGRNSYTLQSAQITDYFTELKSDLVKIAYGSYFLEIASHLTRENNDEREILKLLYRSLQVLERETVPRKLLRCIYEIRILTCFGEGMQVFSCTGCGKEEDLAYFSVKQGGCLCGNCRRHGIDVFRLSDSTLYTLQYIIVTPIEKLYRFLVSEEVLMQLEKISRTYLAQNIREEIKSLEMLEAVEN
jgi:DNA repair protein RecO (recombination protein O)